MKRRIDYKNGPIPVDDTSWGYSERRGFLMVRELLDGKVTQGMIPWKLLLAAYRARPKPKNKKKKTKPINFPL